MLLAKNKRITTKGEDMKKGFIKTDSSAFTLSECTPGGQVRSYTRVPAKGGQIQDSEREAIQPIEKAEQEKQETGLLPDTNLFPYSPVLDLLHAHGDSPEERCSSRLVPFAIRTRFAPSVRKSAIPLFP